MTIPSWTLFGGIPTNAQRDRRHVGSSGGVCKADCGQVPPINPLGAAIANKASLSATALPNLQFPQPALNGRMRGHFTTLSRHGTIPLLPAYMSSQLDLSTVLPVVPSIWILPHNGRTCSSGNDLQHTCIPTWLSAASHHSNINTIFIRPNTQGASRPISLHRGPAPKQQQETTNWFLALTCMTVPSTDRQSGSCNMQREGNYVIHG